MCTLSRLRKRRRRGDCVALLRRRRGPILEAVVSKTGHRSSTPKAGGGYRRDPIGELRHSTHGRVVNRPPGNRCSGP